MSIKIPYGIGDFRLLVEKGYYYVDKTPFLEVMEDLDELYVFFVRPRRFGKSLWLSVLQCYYGIEYNHVFDRLFSNFYIGKNPTPARNTYFVLRFEFSGIRTDSTQTTFEGFLNKVKMGVSDFCSAYAAHLSATDTAAILAENSPETVLQALLGRLLRRNSAHKLYVMIDEYDHFANELLAFRFSEFQLAVGRNGYVRKFYETLKEGAMRGLVERIFITGVTPITLDSLTSGFNIAANLTTERVLGNLMGFTKAETEAIMQGVGVSMSDMPTAMSDVQAWYNGYRFYPEAAEAVYNPDMVLYFAKEYRRHRQYPAQLLDENVASDYTKVGNLFKIGNEGQNLSVLDDLLQRRRVEANLVGRFSFERGFDKNDFTSLLFYMGVLTLRGRVLDRVVLEMPNYVIMALYQQFFQQLVLAKAQIGTHQIQLTEALSQLALHNDPHPIMDIARQVLQELSVRDAVEFSEKHVKAIITSLFFVGGAYTIRSEFEVQKGLTSKGFVDMLLIRRPPFHAPYQFLLELKYVKKQEAAAWQLRQAEAFAQIAAYLRDPFISQLQDLKAYAVVFVGSEPIIEAYTG